MFDIKNRNLEDLKENKYLMLPKLQSDKNDAIKTGFQLFTKILQF